MIVIADASCLIALTNIHEIDVLPKLFGEIYVTPEVANEVGDSLPPWAQTRSSSNHALVNELTTRLEIGEATSIALALELPGSLLVIDEKKGRRTAKQLGIAITGTVGIIMEALNESLIDDPDTILVRLESAGFRISEILKSALRDRIR